MSDDSYFETIMRQCFPLSDKNGEQRKLSRRFRKSQEYALTCIFERYGDVRVADVATVSSRSDTGTLWIIWLIYDPEDVSDQQVRDTVDPVCLRMCRWMKDQSPGPPCCDDRVEFNICKEVRRLEG